MQKPGNPSPTKLSYLPKVNITTVNSFLKLIILFRLDLVNSFLQNISIVGGIELEIASHFKPKFDKVENS